MICLMSVSTGLKGLSFPMLMSKIDSSRELMNETVTE